MDETVKTWFDTLSDTIATPAGRALLNEWLQYQARYPFASLRNSILLLAQLEAPTQLGTKAGWKNTLPQAPATLQSTTATPVWLFDSLIDRVCPECNTPRYEHPDDAPGHCPVEPSPEWEISVVKSIPTALFPSTTLNTPSNTTFAPPYSQPFTQPDEYAVALSETFPANFDGTRFPSLEASTDIQNMLEYLATQTPISYHAVPRDDLDHFSVTDFTLRDPYTFTPVIRSCLADTAAPETRLQDVLETFCYTLLATEIAPDEPTIVHEKKATLAAYALTTLCNACAEFTIPIDPPQPCLAPWANLPVSTLEQYCKDIRDCITTLLIGKNKQN